jgi:hypothetical protein
VPARPDEPRRTRRRWLSFAGKAARPVPFIALIVLKLAGVVDWSWWWVLMPLWAGIVLSALTAGGLLVLFLRHRRLMRRWRLDHGFRMPG